MKLADCENCKGKGFGLKLTDCETCNGQGFVSLDNGLSKLSDERVNSKQPTITVFIEGGVVHDVTGVPEGATLEILDYDVEGMDADRIEEDDKGNEFVRIQY